MKYEQRILDLSLTLPPVPAPVADYIPAVRSGSLVFVSGQIPMHAGALLARGIVPAEVSLETARQCAVQCTLNALAALKGEIGSFDNLTRVVRLGCFVACDPGFTDHPKVADGASELLGTIFTDAGRHARAALGVASLPLNAPVEIEYLFEVHA